MIKHKVKHYRWFLLILCSVVIGLALSVVIFNYQQRKKDLQIEVTFVEPHQAIVFWKTDHSTLGSVSYGESPTKLDHSVNQTSSIPGEIHTAVINDVPLSGLHAKIHNDSDSIFFWPETFSIVFDPNTFE